jgi:hypothetical protein
MNFASFAMLVSHFVLFTSMLNFRGSGVINVTCTALKS